jgi:AraC-like DNA-binding protein
MAAHTLLRYPIQYSCYFSRSRVGEQFIPEHTICYVVSGSIEVSDINGSDTYKEGDLYFCRRNRLGKYTKQPGANGAYRSVSVYLDQDTLRNFSIAYGYTAEKEMQTPAFITLARTSVLASYMNTLREYEAILGNENTLPLLEVKRNEAILLLLQTAPGLKDILFDFSEPGKIDLEAFMNRNFHFNVALERFAYLTGRSLSTFKRDFQKVYHLTPSRWLLQRRLQEAYFLIKEKGRSATDVYIDLGFEDLSHFSHSFKRQYGVAPSQA